MVDLDKSIIDSIPNSVMERNEVVQLSHIIECEPNVDFTYLKNITENLIDEYCRYASLVISSRLHCISPCLALEIPVIPLFENISPRMGWVDKFIEFYTYDEMECIDWNARCKIDDLCIAKKSIESVIRKRIIDTYEKYESVYDLSLFFEKRKKAMYGSLYRKIMKSVGERLQDGFGYTIWGAGQIGMNAYDVISEMYPDSKLVRVIDTYAKGIFYGVQITHPDMIKFESSDIVFITTYSGMEDVKNKLNEKGFQEGVNYFCLASRNG